MNHAILTPVLALITWTLIVWAWMYATRIPAMQAAKINANDAQHPGSLGSLPSGVRAIADNYNHLHEQPTIFYALVFYTLLAGNADNLAVNMAWAYVILRVMHSFVQNVIHTVMLRFAVFAMSSLVLVAMTVRNLMAM
jgi:hypothetical protein